VKNALQKRHIQNQIGALGRSFHLVPAISAGDARAARAIGGAAHKAQPTDRLEMVETIP